MQVYDMFPILKERRSSLAGKPYERRAAANAGPSSTAVPELLMLDEPSLGLAPKIINQIFEIIIALSKSGISLVIVEQNAAVALEIADYAYVFDAGRCSVEGGVHNVLNDPDFSRPRISERRRGPEVVAALRRTKTRSDPAVCGNAEMLWENTIGEI